MYKKRLAHKILLSGIIAGTILSSACRQSTAEGAALSGSQETVTTAGDYKETEASSESITTADQLEISASKDTPKNLRKHSYRKVEGLSDLAEPEKESKNSTASSKSNNGELTQEQLEYLKYLDSIEETEIYLIYDRTQRNCLYFDDYNTESGITFKVKVENIHGSIDTLNQGDLARITYNGAITDDYEIVRVYNIYNQSEEENGEFQEIQSEDSGVVEEDRES